MSEKGLTNISLKKINKSKVYQYIYRKKTTSKLQIVQELQQGLSTVSQNLNLLERNCLRVFSAAESITDMDVCDTGNSNDGTNSSFLYFNLIQTVKLLSLIHIS